MLKKIPGRLDSTVVGAINCSIESNAPTRLVRLCYFLFYAALRDYGHVSREFQVLPLQETNLAKTPHSRKFASGRELVKMAARLKRLQQPRRIFFSRWQFTGVVVETCLQIVV